MADARHLFWAPGAKAPPASAALDRAQADDAHASVVPNAHQGLSLTQQRLRLPVFGHRREILYLVETHATVVIVGHTGSGKTTQIPQYLHEAGWTAGGRLIACTQPRRVAAISVASRVADEMGVEVGADAVGYAVRFDVRADAERTRIMYMTDGTLVREMLADPLLSRFSVVMVDEAHERGLTSDICLALLKKVQKRRKDLRLILASATMEAEALADFFGGTAVGRARPPATAPATAPVAILSLSAARTHEVHRCFLAAPCADYVTEAVRAVLELHERQPPGDVLVFLTGQAEIDAAAAMLTDAVAQAAADRRQRPAGRPAPARPSELLALPLHGALSREAQLAAFAPPPAGCRKVVLATNMAETSVTLDGIVFVVDCGFVKQAVYDAEAGTERLVVAPISQAAAKQRAGRAGRTREGVCLHLYPRRAHDALRAASAPEVQRCGLEGFVLQLKALGVGNVAAFEMPTPPPAAHLAAALELLYALGALDDDAALTSPVGERMAELPLPPLLGRMLLGAAEEGCVEEALSVCALVSVQTVWQGAARAQDAARARFAVYEGDHVTLANVMRGYARRRESPRWAARKGLDGRVLQRAVQVRAQLAQFVRRFGLPVESCGARTERLCRSVARGFFPHAAQRELGGGYRALRGGRPLVIHPRSVLFRAPPELVVYHESQQLSNGDEAMLDVCKVEPGWLTELAPQFYELQRGPGPKRPRT